MSFVEGLESRWLMKATAEHGEKNQGGKSAAGVNMLHSQEKQMDLKRCSEISLSKGLKTGREILKNNPKETFKTQTWKWLNLNMQW